MKQKLNPILYLVYVYQAVLIVAAGLIVALARSVWEDQSLSENPVVLGVLLLSAIVVEARPVRWTAVQYTTLFPTVLLLTLMLTSAPVPVIAISGVGTFVGYGLLREFPVHIRQMPGRTIQRVLFYTAQSIVAATVAGSLYLLLPDSMLTDLMLNAATSFGLVVIYILLSRGFVSVFNRLVSSCWPGDVPLPTPNFLVFFLTASMPFITMLFYQIASVSRYFLVELLGQEGVRVLAILCVWPLALALAYVGSSFLRLGLESEEITEEYDQFLRYSEKMLDMAGVTQLVTKNMKAQFACDDCIVYSWSDKERTYELEGGLIDGQLALRTSAETIPDIGWPKMVEPETSVLGREAQHGELRFFHGKDAQAFLECVGFRGPKSAATLIIPLRYARAGSRDMVRAGFIVLVKRRGTFVYSGRLLAENRLVRKTHPTAIGLRQARLYRDARQFLVKINEAVSKSTGVLAATQALFAQGIDPAKFVTGIGRGAQDYTLARVVESISQGHSSDTVDEVLSDEGIKDLYAQIGQDNPNVPELTDEIKKDIRTVVSFLSLPFVLPYRFPKPEYGGITPEMQALYALFLPALRAHIIADIIALRTRLDRENLKPLAGDFPETVEELSGLQRVIGEVNLSQSPGLENEARIAHLSEALRMLERENGRTVRTTELMIMAQIRNAWASVIYNKIDELRGWSDLTMKLETQAAIAGAEEIVVDLRVSNRGRSAATDITVQIVESTEYDILVPADSRSGVERLEPGQNQRLDFRIRPRRENFVRVAFKATWNDRARDGRTMTYADRVVLKSQAGEFVFIENPYIPGPPLRPGSRLFMGREDVFDFVRSNIGTGEQHNVLILTGQRRTGKTSLALSMSKMLGRDHYVVAYIDGQALGIGPGTDLFWRDLGVMICDGLEDYDIASEPPSLNGTGRSMTEKFEREFLPGVFDAIGGRSLVLVFDEFEELESRVKEGKLDAATFKFLRHLMQHTPNLAFIFVGSHRLQELTQDYWSIFFDLALHKQIGFLDEKAARRLITEPPEQDVFDPYAVDEIVRLTAGHPYFVQLLCHYMVDLRNRSRSPIITVQHVRDAIPDTFVQAEGHLTHLWHTASPMERIVMAAAARVLVGRSSVQASDLVEQLADCRVAQNPQDVLLAEEALAGREILERVDEDPPRYRFKVELIRRWIERNQPLSTVVATLT